MSSSTPGTTTPTTSRSLEEFEKSFGTGARELVSWHVLNKVARDHALNAMYAMMECHEALSDKGLSERKISELMGLPKTSLRRQVGLLLKSKNPGVRNVLELSGWCDEDPKTYYVDVAKISDLAPYEDAIFELVSRSKIMDAKSLFDDEGVEKPADHSTMKGLGFTQMVGMDEQDEGSEE